MNIYVTSALSAFTLFAMGLVALIAGGYNAYENRKSKSGILMFAVVICAFCWDFGYAWMCLCFDDDFAYVPRALALLAVTFYMFFILKYVCEITGFPSKISNVVLTIFLVISLGAWLKIIQKDAVSFVPTAWGYWYYSKMSKARMVQFASVISVMIYYYRIIFYGMKNAQLEREKYVYRRFCLFGPILFTGYIFDTLLPSIFHIPAVPGSSICAFLSCMVLFHISRKNKVFGLSKANVSEYVFEDVDIPVIITDGEGMILLHNEYATQYFGCDSTLLMNSSIERFVELGEDEDVVKILGTDRICQLDMTSVKDQFGVLVYNIYFLHDITKEREAYRAAEENRILAEEANIAKSQFLANMSHEIRTPMNAIIGMSDIIREDKSLPADTIARVNDINIAGNNLLQIINGILDISKIEAGKYELILDTYDLAAVINEVSSIIDVRLYETCIRLCIRIDSSLPDKLRGDVLRVREILLNIMGNAVKYSKQGTITFEVSWDKNQENPTIYFNVTDTGIGIKAEDIDKIFDKFSQVDTRKNRSVQGTGLGLAISKSLAVMMGGDITVTSTYGEGSCFHIAIKQEIEKYNPIGEETAKALESRRYKNLKQNDEVEIVSRPNARVLIVDDTPINIKVAKHMLKKYGMTIDAATSGKQAIEMVKSVDYDLIFMDHMMPEMDGIEATKHIRALGEKYQKLVVIALTANAISEAKEQFLKEGLQDFVAKPIDARLLDEAISRWLPAEQ